MTNITLSSKDKFLKDWRLAGDFEYRTSLEARWAMLRALETESIKVYGWNEVHGMTPYSDRQEYIGWLLGIAQIYLNKIVGKYSKHEALECKLWTKALLIVVKSLPKLLHFSFYPSSYVETLKFLSNPNIYPEFSKEQYSKEVRNLLIESHGTLRANCSSDDPELIEKTAKWKDEHYPNRLYWYSAVISSYHFDLVHCDRDEIFATLLKLRLFDYLKSDEAKKRGHNSLGDLLNHRYPKDPYTYWLDEFLQRSVRLGHLDELLVF